MAMPSERRRLTARILIAVFLAGFCSFAFSTLPLRLFTDDHFKLIEYSKEFRLVGMRGSHLNWNFPMVHYLLAPVVAISDNPFFMYALTPISFVIAYLMCVRHFYSRGQYLQVSLFTLATIAVTSQLHFATFAWPPNLIPFFSTILWLAFIRYLSDSSRVFWFYVSVISLTVIVYLHALSAYIGVAFVGLVVLSRAIPARRHLVIAAVLMAIPAIPWLVFHLTIMNPHTEPAYRNALFERSPSNWIRGWIAYLSGDAGWVNNDEGMESIPAIFWSVFLIAVFIRAIKKAKIHVARFSTSGWHACTKAEKTTFSDESRTGIWTAVIVAVPLMSFFGLRAYSAYFEALFPVIPMAIADLIPRFRRSSLWIAGLLVTVTVQCFTLGQWWNRVLSEPPENSLKGIGVFAESVSANCIAKPASLRIADGLGIRPLNEAEEYLFKRWFKAGGQDNCADAVFIKAKLLDRAPYLSWFLEHNFYLKETQKEWIIATQRRT